MPKNLDELRQYLTAELEKLTPSNKRLDCEHDILSALCVAGF